MRRSTAVVLVTALLFFITGAGWALPMGERQVAGFEREAVRAVRALVLLPAETEGQRLVIRVAGQPVCGLRVRDARVEFLGMKKELLEIFKRGEGSFSDLRELDAIEADGFVEADALQSLVDQELARVRPEKQLVQNLKIGLGKDEARISGNIDLYKILPGFLGFMPKWSSTFTAVVTVRLEGARILIESREATLNGQPMNDDLEKKLLEWLNPVWDFGALPYPAVLEKVTLHPEGIAFNGWLFSR